MRILLFLEICLIAVGIWSAKEDFAPLVLPVGEQADSVEGRLRWAYWQTRSGGKYGFLYILDCGMSDETAQICRRFAREYGNIEIGSLAQLEQRLTGGGDLQP